MKKRGQSRQELSSFFILILLFSSPGGGVRCSLSGGQRFGADFPVDIAVGLHTVHGIDTAVVVDPGQFPFNFIVGWDDKRMVQEAGFSLRKGGIAGIEVIGDGIGGFDQFGELFISSDQIRIGDFVDVAVDRGE